MCFKDLVVDKGGNKPFLQRRSNDRTIPGNKIEDRTLAFLVSIQVGHLLGVVLILALMAELEGVLLRGGLCNQRFTN